MWGRDFLVGSGEWGVGSGKWGVGSGEWGVGSGMGQEICFHAYFVRHFLDMTVICSR